MAKILIVEDDHNLAATMKRSLLSFSHVVDVVNSSDDAREYLHMHVYELLVLDWELPGGSGIQVCRDYRARGGLSPVLFVTGRQQIDDKVTGFEAGGDDYLTKPFHIQEFQARIKALLKRPVAIDNGIVKVAGLVLDTNKRRVTVNGSNVDLMPIEFALLQFMMRHEGEVFNIDALIARVWPVDKEVTHDAVRQVVKRLRKKIDPDADNSWIETVAGFGYRLSPIEED